MARWMENCFQPRNSLIKTVRAVIQDWKFFVLARECWLFPLGKDSGLVDTLSKAVAVPDLETKKETYSRIVYVRCESGKLFNFDSYWVIWVFPCF